MEGRQLRNCEGLNYCSSNVVNYPSSDCVSVEEELAKYLNKIDEIVEKRHYMEATTVRAKT